MSHSYIEIRLEEEEDLKGFEIGDILEDDPFVFRVIRVKEDCMYVVPDTGFDAWRFLMGGLMLTAIAVLVILLVFTIYA